jgi:endonuclease/exonuclease/phosphatase family metal-dependent hydrolase
MVFLITSGAYGVSLTAYIILRGLTGERFNSVALIANFLHVMVLAAVVLFVIVLIARRWLLVTELLLPAATGIVYLWGVFVPTTLPITPIAMPTLNVLSYNIYAHTGDYSATQAVIEQAAADIVLIQEYNFSAEAALIPPLETLYPYRALDAQPIGTQGQGVLSIYPILESAYFQNGLPVQLGHQRLVIDFNGQPIVIYNVHPAHPLMSGGQVANRSQDIERLLARAEADAAQYPVMLIGDFNLTDQTADYAALSARYTDAFASVGYGLGYTFPNLPDFGIWQFVPPLARIDYQFGDARWQAISARVWPTAGGSDHYPLLVKWGLMG